MSVLAEGGRMCHVMVTDGVSRTRVPFRQRVTLWGRQGDGPSLISQRQQGLAALSPQKSNCREGGFGL